MPCLDPVLVDMLRRLADGIVAVVGPHCEVVIHDFGDLEHSVVAIAGNVTGRKPGAPVPDLAFTSADLNCQTPDQINYCSKLGSRDLRSSTIWIRDADGRPIGAVCINVDYSDLVQVRELIEKMTGPAREAPELVVSDTFARDTDELIDAAVSAFLRQEAIPGLQAMSYEDKLRLIQAVESRGLFRIRGAVSRVADLLNVSRASVYNYRSSLKNDGAPAGG